MDEDVVPKLEKEFFRRRRRRLFSHSRVPVRMLVPNFFTLLGLCAGLTSIRMGIEGRYDLALAAIVFAACLDGMDGRVARFLKASSRFGAELDSLADFVNFGVAPAFLMYTWGLGAMKSLGWICVMIFALASALRLARFNAALDEEKPKWQSNYFTGMPTPAAAIVVMLPLYLHHVGIEAMKSPVMLNLALVYTLFVAFMMVSTIPTYSGKLLGERIGREWVLPIFIVAVAFVALLFSYPYEVLAMASLGYLATIPVSVRRYEVKKAEMPAAVPAAPVVDEGASATDVPSPPAASTETAKPDAASPSGRVFPFRPNDPTRG